MRRWGELPDDPELSMLPGQDCLDPQHQVNLYPDGATLQAVLALDADGGGQDLATGPGGFGELRRAGQP